MTEPTLKQWKRRALAAQEELATIQRMRSMDAAREMEMARENAVLRDVLEQAAKACEDAVSEHKLHSNFICAMYIRAMKEQIN